MPDCTFNDPIPDACWHARLSLGCTRDGGCTRLVRRVHRGPLRQRTRIRIDGRPVWSEQGAITPASLAGPMGLRGHGVWATLVAVSQVKQVFVARFAGDDSERACALHSAAWPRTSTSSARSRSTRC